MKKIGGSLDESLAKMEDKMENMDGTKKELTLKVSDIEKASCGLKQELASLTGLKTKAPTWDRKADSEEVDKLNSLLTEEVNKIQKEIKDILKRNEDLKKEMSSKPVEVKSEVNPNQLKAVETNCSRLTELVTSLQGQLASQQESSTEQVEQLNVTIRGLRKGLDTLSQSHESKQSGALGMINKQARGWEEAREKAEQMSQIFDSLIITSKCHPPPATPACHPPPANPCLQTTGRTSPVGWRCRPPAPA